MRPFSIDRAALAEIQRIFSNSECSEPVAQLYERAGVGYLFEAVHGALIDGTMTPEELSAMARKRVGEVATEVRHLNFSLMVGAAERADCRSTHLHEIGGITFAMNSRVVEELRDYCLTFENNHFVFKDARNTAHTLSAILARSQK
jgi:hypothetical protein